MLVLYDSKTDLLYIRLDEQTQDVLHRRISDDVVLDIGADDRIVGIQIMDASRRVNLQQLLPVACRVFPEAASLTERNAHQQLKVGRGDYTAERHSWLDSLDVQAIIDEIAHRQDHPPPP